MKRFSDAITVIAFFAILLMFAFSTIFSGTSFEISDSEGIKMTTDSFIQNNFPLSGNWKSLYANILTYSGRNKFGNIYVLEDKLVNVNKSSEKKALSNVDCINSFAENISVPVYVMAVPTAAGIYSSELPVYANQSDDKELIDKIYMGLDNSISTLDAYYPLYSARDEYVFYRTEDMWTSLGAYFVYEQSIGKLGFEPQTMQNYDLEYASSSFTGELYEKVRYSSIQPDKINLFRSKYQTTVTSTALIEGEQEINAKSVYFKSALNTDKKTDIYLQGDKFKKAVVETTVEDAPKLLIIKGSYANTFMPFLTPHYSEITLVDPKQLKESGEKLSDIVDVSDYDQILFLYDVCDFSTADCFDVLN